MKTVLDDARMWLLDRIEYTDVLRLVLVEMFVLDQNVDRTDDDPKVAEILADSRPIETTENSRRFMLVFDNPITWHVVDESLTNWDKTEISDDTGVIQKLSRSKYLEYVNQNHGWYESFFGNTVHYRVCTANEVIEVMSCGGPPILMPQ